MATDSSIGPFPLGMDNRVPDFKLGLPRGAGHLLRDALNVDVTETGAAACRDLADRHAALDAHVVRGAGVVAGLGADLERRDAEVALLRK